MSGSLPIPVLGICAYGSGAGKTTLLTALIPMLKARDIRVSVIKHAHHQFDIDHPGKDSYKIREAGAVQTLVTSNKRWALMTELPDQNADAEIPALDDLIAKLDKEMADLVLIEGYRDAGIPKIEIFRPCLNYPRLHQGGTIAIACDTPIESTIPVLDLNQPRLIADFIMHWLKTQNTQI